MYLVINKWVIAVKISNFSAQYLRKHWTLDIGILGYIGIVWPKEHSPELGPFLLGHPVCMVHTSLDYFFNYVYKDNSNFKQEMIYKF